MVPLARPVALASSNGVPRPLRLSQSGASRGKHMNVTSRVGRLPEVLAGDHSRQRLRGVVGPRVHARGAERPRSNRRKVRQDWRDVGIDRAGVRFVSARATTTRLPALPIHAAAASRQHGTATSDGKAAKATLSPSQYAYPRYTLRTPSQSKSRWQTTYSPANDQILAPSIPRPCNDGGTVLQVDVENRQRLEQRCGERRLARQQRPSINARSRGRGSTSQRDRRGQRPPSTHARGVQPRAAPGNENTASHAGNSARGTRAQRGNRLARPTKSMRADCTGTGTACRE